MYLNTTKQNRVETVCILLYMENTTCVEMIEYFKKSSYGNCRKDGLDMKWFPQKLSFRFLEEILGFK